MTTNGTLPTGWLRCTLGTIARTITKGTTPTSNGFPFTEEGIRFVRVENVQNGHIDTESIRQFISEDAHKSQHRSQLQTGDILFSIAGTIGRTCVVKAEDIPANTNQALAIIRGTHIVVISRFLNFQLSSLLASSLRSKARGGAMNNISLDDLKRFTILVSPLPEQHRIVAKVEELFSDLDAGAAALKKTQVLLKRYRQSVLKAAFAGKLTAKWREANKGKLETASVLLERIQAERKKAGDKKAKELPPLDTTDLPELPKGWAWASLGMVTDIKGGITKGERKSEGVAYRAVPYLRVANVQRGYFDLVEMKMIEASPEDIAALRLQKGDILFNEGGDRDKLGRGWVWNNELPECIHQNHVFRARVLSEAIQPKYISYYGNEMGAKYFTEEGKQTTNLASINMTKLSRLPIPFAPRSEQELILAEMERLFTIADQVEKTIEQSLKQSQRLRQSILKRAFSGRLVPQDPKDDPAEKLLERIKAERTKVDTDKSKRPRKGAK